MILIFHEINMISAGYMLSIVTLVLSIQVVVLRGLSGKRVDYEIKFSEPSNSVVSVSILSFALHSIG